MKKLAAILCLSAAFPFLANAADTSTQQKLDGRLDAARVTIDQIMAAPDKAVPDSIARKAVCVGVIPSVVKGAFIVGAE